MSRIVLAHTPRQPIVWLSSDVDLGRRELEKLRKSRTLKNMGLAHAQITLDNPKRADLQPLFAQALADTESLYLCIPENVKLQLQLEATSQKTVITTDRTRSLCDYVGPVRVRFENRECYVGAVVLGDEVLLGAIPMEDMDLVVTPPVWRFVVNPLHPNFTEGPAKGYKTD